MPLPDQSATVAILWPVTLWLAYELGYRDGERIGRILGAGRMLSNVIREAGRP